MRDPVFDAPVQGSVAHPELGDAMQAAKRVGPTLPSLGAEASNLRRSHAIAAFLHRGGRRRKVRSLPCPVAETVSGRLTQGRARGWRWVGTEDWAGLRVRVAVPEALCRPSKQPAQLALW